MVLSARVAPVLLLEIFIHPEELPYVAVEVLEVIFRYALPILNSLLHGVDGVETLIKG